jgi:hypothetical protein
VKIHYVLIFFIALLSCSKEAVYKGRNLSGKYFIRKSVKSCKGVSFGSDSYKRDNVLNFFDCIGYDKAFSGIHKYIKNLDDKSYSSFEKLFSSMYPTLNNFLDITINKLDKESTKHLSHIISIILDNPDLIKKQIAIFQNRSKSEYKDISQIVFEAITFLSGFSEEQDEYRINMISSLNPDLLKRLIGETIKSLFSNKMISKKSSLFISEKGWINDTLNRIEVSSLKKIVEFNLLNPTFIKHVGYYEESILTPKYNCYDYSKTYIVDHSVEYQWQLSNLVSKASDDFYLDIVELITRFNLYRQICPSDIFIPKTTELLRQVISFLDIDGGFSLLRQFARISMSEDEKFDLSIINFFKSNVFKTFVELVQLIENDKVYDDIYLFLKSISSKDYARLASLLNTLSKNESFLDFLDSKYQSDNLDALVDLIYNIISTEKEYLSSFRFLFSLVDNASDINLDKEDYINLLGVFVEVLTDNNLVNELKKMFDNSHLLYVLGLIQKNETVSTAKSLNNFLLENIEKSSVSSYTYKECVRQIMIHLNGHDSLGDIISNYPEVCRDIEEEKKNFALKIYEWSQNINAGFFDEHGFEFAGQDGLLNPRTMHFMHQMIHVTTKYIKSDNDFSKDTVNKVKKYLLEDNNIKYIESFLENALLNNKKNLVELFDLLSSSPSSNVNNDLKLLFGFFESVSEKKSELKFSIEKADVEYLRNLNLNTRKFQSLLKCFEKNKLSISQLGHILNFLGQKRIIKKLTFILNELEFKNYHYVAFFINQLAKAKSYQKAITKLKRQFKLALSTNKALIKLGYLPADGKRRLLIVNENLGVLDLFLQKMPGSKKSYGDILKIIAEGLYEISSKEAKDISLFTKGSRGKSKKHFGTLLGFLSRKGLLNKVLFTMKGVSSELMGNHVIPWKLFEDIDIGNVDIGKLEEKNYSVEIPSLDNVELGLKKYRYNDFKRLMSYLKILFKFDMKFKGKSIKNLYRLNVFFKVMSDSTINYIPFVETLQRLHSNDENYLLSLLEYSVKKDESNVTRLRAGFSSMFIKSNLSLINFFKDILAHFKYKPTI